MQVQVSLTIELEASVGISEMEEQIQEAGQQAMGHAMKEAVRQWEDEQRICSHCGQAQSRLEGTARRVIATCFGRVTVQRRRFRCLACGHRYCPANRLFASLKGVTMTPSLREAAMLAGCSWPSRVAASLLKRLSGAQISAEEIRLLTNQQGKRRAQQQQEAAEQVCSSLAEETPSVQTAETVPTPSANHTEQPRLVGLDGGWVGNCDQRGGMEGKVAV